MIREFSEGIMAGVRLTRGESINLASVSGPGLYELFAMAGVLRSRFRGRKADLCAIVSAKTGACPEDCSYCAQSSRSGTGIGFSPLADIGHVLDRARAAMELGARRFCIVTSGKRPSGDELRKIASMVSGLRDLGVLPCATLGLLGREDLLMLKASGLHRYHHNLETSERYFPSICRTHTYADKLRTIEAAQEAGLSVCSGGIFGTGESWEDRIDMAMALRGLGVDSVPLNFLVPIKGTPLGGMSPLGPMEALKIISIYRFMIPDREIRVCGGRLQSLGEFNSLVFLAGADGLLTGDCLTVSGRDPLDDLRLVEGYGMSV